MLTWLGWIWLASAPPATSLVIAEVSSRDDWVEIANLGAATVSLEGWRVHSRKSGVKLAGEIRSGERIVVPLAVSKGDDRVELAGDTHVVDALVLPRMPRGISYGRDDSGAIGFFAEPTPGGPPKAPAQRGITVAPNVRPSRGIYRRAIDVSLAGARYTLDGTDPSGRAIGSSRIRIEPTRSAVVLRTVREEPPLLPSEVVSHTYVFPAAVLRQDGGAFPPAWGTGPSSTTADYAMRPHPGCRLEALPTVSIAIDPNELFDPARGIYSVPAATWERRANVELLPFGRDPGFSMQAGLRIQGGSSTRRWKSKKLSFRLRFAKEYDGRLDHRLFPDPGGHRFANLILDAQLNLTWIHPDPAQRARAQYVRDAFVADSIRAIGGVAPRGRFVHLYLAGLYWGVYFLHERPDAHFAAAHLGGKRKDWEVVRHGPRWIGGKGPRWNEMMEFARGGLGDDDRYRVFGEQHLDVPLFIDYLLVNFWAGNEDWPANNFYAAASPDRRWRFMVWDAERVLTDVNLDRTGASDRDSPGELLASLMPNAAFRRQLHLRARALLRGELGRERAAARYLKRIEELRPAIACEAARWGDALGPTYTKRDWDRELARLRREWFPKRNEIFRRQLEERLRAGASR